MSRALLFQLDGKLPNLALMRIAAHHRARGDTVELRRAGNFQALEPELGESAPQYVYGSAIFRRSLPLAERLTQLYPRAIVGGTGVDIGRTLDDIGIATTGPLAYDLYPGYRQSIGFTQRGCRLRCGFCVVPTKEGAPKSTATIAEIWRGDPWPKELLLLDNDFFGEGQWRTRLEEIIGGGFKVSFNQGINARFLTDETAAAIGSVDYRADDMKAKRIYTAWDNRKDEARLLRGLRLLTNYGVKPDHIMVYMLIGYWPGETHEDREHRRALLREFGARPYPMPFERTPELIAYQRWVIGAYDKQIPWSEWSAARFRPEKLQRRTRQLPLVDRSS